jgi:hypothetical protein
MENKNRIWYLHWNQKQFGPFLLQEIQQFLREGRIHPEVYAWCHGMTQWQKLGVILEQTKKLEAHVSEKRSFPRLSIEARILISDEKSVIVGSVCDMSLGGLQVLANRVPVKVGSKIKMNVSPTTGLVTNMVQRQFDPFVAKGTVVRLLEKSRGFSFRFEKLSKQAQQSIESYLGSFLGSLSG